MQLTSELYLHVLPACPSLCYYFKKIADLLVFFFFRDDTFGSIKRIFLFFLLVCWVFHS